MKIIYGNLEIDIQNENTLLFYYEFMFKEDAVKGVSKEFYIISEREFSKICLQKLEPLRSWFANYGVVNQYNRTSLEKCTQNSFRAHLLNGR